MEGGSSEWRSVSELAGVVGMRPSRVIQQWMEGVQTPLHGGPAEDFHLRSDREEFPPVAVAAAVDGRLDLRYSLLSLEMPQLGDFAGVSKKALYLVGVIVHHQAALGWGDESIGVVGRFGVVPYTEGVLASPV